MSKSEKFWMALAWKLPKKLVYWAAIRVFANATGSKYGKTVVVQLTVMDALKRWDDDA